MPDLNTLNDYGIPLHACNGYRQDEHYWCWLAAQRLGLCPEVPGRLRIAL